MKKIDVDFKKYADVVKKIVTDENEKAVYPWKVKVNKGSIVLDWSYGVSFKIGKIEVIDGDWYMIKSVCDYGYGFDTGHDETFVMIDIEDTRWSDARTIDESVPMVVEETISKANHLF